MSDFSFSIDDLLQDNFDAVINRTAEEQTKQISPVVGKNKNLSTTLSQQKDFDPTGNTIYDVGDMLQNSAAYRRPEDLTSSFEQVLSGPVLQATSGLLFSSQNPLAFLKYLLPDDVHVAETSDSGVPGSSSSPGGSDPSSPGTGPTSEPFTGDAKELANQVLNHAQLKGIGADNKKDISTGQISPYVMASLKLIMDNNIGIWITATKTDHSAKTKTGTTSLHNSGRAVDIRPSSGAGSIASNTGWIDSVFRVLDSVSMPQRCKEVLGPYVYGGGGVRGKSGYYIGKQDSRGTYWGTAADHQNHIHFGITAWGPK